MDAELKGLSFDEYDPMIVRGDGIFQFKLSGRFKSQILKKFKEKNSNCRVFNLTK